MTASLKAGRIAGWTAMAALALAATSTAQAASLDLTIGSLLESTGPLSELGPTAEKATKLAVDAANKAAKDAGVAATVTLASADAQGDPQAALSAARTLIDKNAA